MNMKIGQRKIDTAPIARALAKNPPIEESPVMTKNLSYLNRMVGKSKPAKIDMKAYKEAQVKVNSYKAQTNLSYLNMILAK